MHTPDQSSNVEVGLYELFAQLSDAAIDDRRRRIDAIFVHPEWDLNLRIACGRVLKRLPKHSDTRADLLQETVCLLGAALVQGKLQYRDLGVDRFKGWLRRVAFNAARQALTRCQPLSFDRIVLMDMCDLDLIVISAATQLQFDDVLIAISQLRNQKTRHVLRDWAHGLSLAKSAERQGLTVAVVWRTRQRGRDQLRQLLLHE